MIIITIPNINQNRMKENLKKKRRQAVKKVVLIKKKKRVRERE